MSEHTEQCAFFDWIGLAYPDIIAFAIPNGGHRHKSVGAKLKREGVKAGVPDIFIADGKPGLFIELKTGSNKPSILQSEMIDRLRLCGYSVAVCYGWDEARLATEMYLRNKVKLFFNR